MQPGEMASVDTFGKLHQLHLGIDGWISKYLVSMTYIKNENTFSHKDTEVTKEKNTKVLGKSARNLK